MNNLVRFKWLIVITLLASGTTYAELCPNAQVGNSLGQASFYSDCYIAIPTNRTPFMSVGQVSNQIVFDINDRVLTPSASFGVFLGDDVDAVDVYDAGPGYIGDCNEFAGLNGSSVFGPYVAANTYCGVLRATLGDLFMRGQTDGTTWTNILIWHNVNEQDPVFEKEFNPDQIEIGETSTLTFTLTNLNSDPLTGLSFTDDFPDDLVIANPPNVSSTCGVVPSAVAGDGEFNLVGGVIAGGPDSTCTISVDVTAATEGVKRNVADNISSTEFGEGSDLASDRLNVISPQGEITEYTHVFVGTEPKFDSPYCDEYPASYFVFGPVIPSVTGDYKYVDLSISFDIDMQIDIYLDNFDPSNPTNNYIGGGDDEDEFLLNAGSSYFFVMSELCGTDDESNAVGTMSFSLEAPFEEDTSSATPIPSMTVWGLALLIGLFGFIGFRRHS